MSVCGLDVGFQGRSLGVESFLDFGARGRGCKMLVLGLEGALGGIWGFRSLSQLMTRHAHDHAGCSIVDSRALV